MKYNKEENHDVERQHGDHVFRDGKQFYLLRESGLQKPIMVKVDIYLFIYYLIYVQLASI